MLASAVLDVPHFTPWPKASCLAGEQLSHFFGDGLAKDMSRYAVKSFLLAMVDKTP
jgi:hypothetical protein